jgi:RNA polymerase sigma-70 factor (ECF subfamily)
MRAIAAFEWTSATSSSTRLSRGERWRSGSRPADVDALAADLDEYHLFHATRAELLRALGDDLQARTADQRAVGLTANPVEQALLRERLDHS